MLLRRFLSSTGGCASYVFGCTSHGRLAVVDPRLDMVEDYVETAESAASRITEVIDTHVHADHRSGARRLAEQTGAALRLPAGAPVDFEFVPLRDHDVIELGNTRVDVIDTPGHAWAHASLVVTDRSRGHDPWAVFTGDTLFVGAVGRPDLHGQERELAAALRRSVGKLMRLPDWVELLPGHIGGSACGTGISGNPSSTIGYERANSKLLNGLGEEAFVERVLSRLGDPPAEFAEIYRFNQLQRPGATTAEVDTYARSQFDDTRRGAEKFGAMGSTTRATKPEVRRDP